MPRKDSLRTYRKKRDFGKTTEPEGESVPSAPAGAPQPRRVFVIQKHDATALHYDFRLEVDGILKSWAVPKGPSLDPRQRRLAMPTEDHPMDYATFEGVIPKGQYGAGPVIVWDAGVYHNLEVDPRGKEVPMAKCVEQGRVEVLLTGRKIVGAFALVRAGTDPRGRARWLMIKMKDQHADARRHPVSSKPRSVLSDRTIEQVARGK